MTFPLLDGLRAVAALGVFVYHLDHEVQLPWPLHLFASHGNAGVPLFFVLSGFLLYRPLVIARVEGRPILIGRFYARRAARILPAYWLALTLLAIYPGLERFADRWWQLYLLGQGFDPHTVFAGIGPAWSLAIEASFYLLLPLYALALGGRVSVVVEAAMLALLAMASVGYHEWVGSTKAPLLGYTLPGTFYLFAAGMLIAVLHARTTLVEVLTTMVRAPVLLWVSAAAAFVTLSETVPAATLGSVHPAYGILSILVFLPAIMGGRAAVAVLGWRPLAALGVVSYGFYLWHQEVVEAVARFEWPWWLCGAVALLITVTVATASYRIVELPVLELMGRRNFRRHQGETYVRVTDKIKAMPVVGSAARKAAGLLGRRRFAGSADYWESRYQGGGTSGAGSYGRLAEHKADILNRFVAEHDVHSVVELGCGDGAQLELAAYPTYTGVDVARATLDRCRGRFDLDPTKRFVHLDDLEQVVPHELALSLDVVYHLVEDEVFEAHMRALFGLATRNVIVYSSNHDASHGSPHVRHRQFTRWIEDNAPSWALERKIANEHPAQAGSETGDTSFADFYVFARRASG